MKKSLIQSPWIDLYTVLFFTIAAIIFILVPPFNETLLRIPFALILLLFLPGYTFIAALFPRDDLSGIERFTLSIGLSIAITIFDGFALNYTAWGFRPVSICLSLAIIILFFTIITFLIRRRIPDNECFVLDPTSFIESLKTEEEASDIEKALIFALVVSIILASGMVIYAKLTFPQEKFTALYILGQDGMAEEYRIDLYIGEETSTIVGIENHEHALTNYTLQVRLGGHVLESLEVGLDHKTKWEQDVSFVPDCVGTNLKLEFLLFKEGGDGIYRSNHLWVTSGIAEENSNILRDYLIAPPAVSNWNMEDTAGWVFTGHENFNGTYARHLLSLPGHSYQISFPPGQPSKAGEFAEVYQDVTSKGRGIVMLSFDVKDSIISNTSGYHFKQVLINGEVIWEDDAAGDEGWQHVSIPVTLNAGSNRLGLRLFEKKGVGNLGVNTWWDSVRFETLTSINISAADTEIYPGMPIKVTLDIRNRELEYTNYTLEMKLNGHTVETRQVGMDGISKLTEVLSLTPKIIGSNLTLEGLLYREGENEPYKRDYLTVSSLIDYDDIEGAVRYAISPPHVLNHDMESNSSWDFTGISFTGGYTDDTSVSPAHSYKISLPSQTPTNSTEFGAACQDIIASESGIAVLVFDVKDSHTANSSGYHYKQVVINDNIVWEDDAAGDEGWQHVEIPVGLNKGSNRLNLRVYEKKGVGNFRVDTWWDNARFELFTGQRASVTSSLLYAPFIEIRGIPVSIRAGQTVKINSGNFHEFESTEELEMIFTLDGRASPYDATYTTSVSSGNIWHMGHEYRSLDPARADLLADILIDGSDRKINETWVLKDGYNLTVKEVNNISDSVWLELSRDGVPVTSDILQDDETFEYRTDLYGANDVILLTCELDSILPDGFIKIEDLYQYSDTPVVINIGDKYGEFEVKAVDADKIVLRNPQTITLAGVNISIGMLFNESLGFKVSGNGYTAYPFVNKTEPGLYEIRGVSGSIASGNRMNITGFNYQPFCYDLDTNNSFEELNMYFSKSGYVASGDASYNASMSGDEIGFMGRLYRSFNLEGGALLSNVLINESEKILKVKESYVLKEGYVLILNDITSDSAWLELTKNGIVVESGIYSEGDPFIYEITENGINSTVFECEVDDIFYEQFIILRNIEQYSDAPLRLEVGDEFGEFEVTAITGNSIQMTNYESFTVSDGSSILDGLVYFDVSGSTAYPFMKQQIK